MQTSPVISEFLMEQVIEELELQCWEQVQTILKSQEGLGIEYDENVICDVCRSVRIFPVESFFHFVSDRHKIVYALVHVARIGGRK